MSARGEAYFAEKMAADQTAAARAARVKEFIADSDPEIIADLFAEIKDAVIDRAAEEACAVTRCFHTFTVVLSDVETELCN